MIPYDVKRTYDVGISINKKELFRDKVYDVDLEEARIWIEDKAKELYPNMECEIFFGCSQFGGAVIINT